MADLDQGIFADLADSIVDEADIQVDAEDHGIHMVQQPKTYTGLFDDDDENDGEEEINSSATQASKTKRTAATADDNEDGAAEDIDWQSRATEAERERAALERKLRKQEQDEQANKQALNRQQREAVKASWDKAENDLKGQYQNEYRQLQDAGASEREMAYFNRYYRAEYDKIKAQRDLQTFAVEVGPDFLEFAAEKDARNFVREAVSRTNEAFDAVNAHKSLQLTYEDVVRNGRLPKTPDEARELVKAAYRRRSLQLQQARVKATANNSSTNHRMPTQGGAAGGESFDKVRAGYMAGKKTLAELIVAGRRATPEQRRLAGI